MPAVSPHRTGSITISSTGLTDTQSTHRQPPHPIPIEHIDPDALKVVRRLKRYGHTAYLVGGCVRDLLLGRTPKDFDVGTSARPRQVKHLFRNSRIIGRRFRLVHVVFGRKIIEVATFRSTQEAPELPEEQAGSEGETTNPEMEGVDPSAAANNGEGGRPGADGEDAQDVLIRSDNVFGTPEQDAFRRDFTVNGLFYDPETEQVIDHVGGLDHLERRVLRTIGDPELRFREDPVRIVRAVKFAARLHFAIDPATFDAMIRTAPELAKAAPPRLAEEIVRLAQGGAGAESFRLMHELGILPYVAPSVSRALAEATERGTVDGGPEGLFWKQLEAIDRWPWGPSDLSRATVLAVVYGPVYRQSLEKNPQAQRDPGAAFFNAVRPAISDRLLSRREADRMKLIYVAQRRLESPPGKEAEGAGGGGAAGGGRRRRRRGGGGGGGKSLASRDYFREAVAFFRIDASARGSTSDAWDAWEALLPQAPPARDVAMFHRRDEQALASMPPPDDEEEPPSAEEIAALNNLPEDEDFGRRRRRGRSRGGRLSEDARERRRMETTAPGESGGVPEKPASDHPEWLSREEGPEGEPLPEGEAADALPRLAKPARRKERTAEPAVPKPSPAERVARAMTGEDGKPLVNPYTNRPYVPRKMWDEAPAAARGLEAGSAEVAAGAMVAPAAGTVPVAEETGGDRVSSDGYTVDDFETAGEPDPDEALITKPGEGVSRPTEEKKKRRRRGRRGRGRSRREGEGAEPAPAGADAAPAEAAAAPSGNGPANGGDPGASS